MISSWKKSFSAPTFISLISPSNGGDKTCDTPTFCTICIGGWVLEFLFFLFNPTYFRKRKTDQIWSSETEDQPNTISNMVLQHTIQPWMKLRTIFPDNARWPQEDDQSLNNNSSALQANVLLQAKYVVCLFVCLFCFLFFFLSSYHMFYFGFCMFDLFHSSDFVWLVYYLFWFCMFNVFHSPDLVWLMHYLNNVDSCFHILIIIKE